LADYLNLELFYGRRPMTITREEKQKIGSTEKLAIRWAKLVGLDLEPRTERILIQFAQWVDFRKKLKP
jgi:hypothetical protein